MNVEIRIEAAQFPEKECISGIFDAVYCNIFLKFFPSLGWNSGRCFNRLRSGRQRRPELLYAAPKSTTPFSTRPFTRSPRLAHSRRRVQRHPTRRWLNSDPIRGLVKKTELSFGGGMGKDWTLWLGGQEKTELCERGGRKRLNSVIVGQEKTELRDCGAGKTELCDCGAGKDWTLWLWGWKRLNSVMGGGGQEKTKLCESGTGKKTELQTVRKEPQKVIDRLFWPVQDIWQSQWTTGAHNVCTLYSI